MPVLLGLIAVVLTFLTLRAYTRVSPAFLAALVRRGGGALALATGGLLLARGRLDLGLALGTFGMWLMGLNRLPTFSIPGFHPVGGRARSGGKSHVRSAMIEMELDHATGAISGVIIAGRDEGKALAALSREQLLDLYRLCLADEPDGARLLGAYLDRRFSGWRATGDQGANARGGEPRARRPGAISEDEAYEILGLKKGAPPADIARAHRDLMKKLHPDHGGTTDLAARVNEAKDVLMRRHN
ncbi:MAG: DnaJ domain-containing protein [Methylocystis sp.]|nr:DnaJ domain-containing protein [Methylocystis sp.]